MSTSSKLPVFTAMWLVSYSWQEVRGDAVCRHWHRRQLTTGRCGSQSKRLLPGSVQQPALQGCCIVLISLCCCTGRAGGGGGEGVVTSSRGQRLTGAVHAGTAVASLLMPPLSVAASGTCAVPLSTPIRAFHRYIASALHCAAVGISHAERLGGGASVVAAAASASSSGRSRTFEG